MKISDFYTENVKEIKTLIKLKLPLKKSTEKLILSQFIPKETRYYSLIQLWRGKIIERIFATRLKKGKPEYQEVIRRIEGNSLIGFKNMYSGMMCGNRTVWSDSRVSAYYWNWDFYNYWDYIDMRYFRVWNTPIYTLNEIKALDPSLKYCAWNEDFSIIDYVTIYRKYPEIEILSKLEYNRLLYNTNILNKLRDKKFVKFLWKNSIEDFRNKKNVTGQIVLKAFKNNLSISEAYARNKIEKDFKRFEFKTKYPMLDIFKTYIYLQKQKTNLVSYMDMLEAEKYFHLDLNDTKNSYPNNFQYWHDFYTKQMSADKNKAIDEGIEKAATKFKKMEKTIDGLSLIFPHSTQELINEGEALHHCVGRMGYNKKIAKGESLILFVRKEEDLNTPLITMEYDPNAKRILQLYGDHDTPPEESIKDIVYNKWLPKVKRIRFA